MLVKQKDKEINGLQINTYKKNQVTFDKGEKTTKWNKGSLFAKGAETTRHPHAERKYFQKTYLVKTCFPKYTKKP